MTTLVAEGAGLPSGAESFSAGVSGAPNRVAVLLRLAIGSLERTGAMNGTGEGVVDGEDAGLAWRHVDGERQMLRVNPTAPEEEPTIRFHSGDKDKPALEVHDDGSWRMGEASGEVDTIAELIEVGNPAVSAEALTLLGTADAVVTRSRASSPLPGSTS